ncbi:MAG: hypothetical protein E7680_02725 [Ruminococcaceae bacterium]|nr:hypothetical protein [Oscillospiraceae bacterium]
MKLPTKGSLFARFKGLAESRFFLFSAPSLHSRFGVALRRFISHVASAGMGQSTLKLPHWRILTFHKLEVERTLDSKHWLILAFLNFAVSSFQLIHPIGPFLLCTFILAHILPFFNWYFKQI